jgi:deoxycytidine triphosphate deaminase/cell division protein FtsB
MLLSGEAINQRRLVNNAINGGFRGASYDLHIGKIIDPDGGERDTYELPAQGIVAVVSRETVNIPKNVAGFATVKTSLCDQGILAINIGIIDPLYSSSLSSFLVNFGKNSHVLAAGQVFLRLTFFEFAPDDKSTPFIRSTEDYVREKKRTILQHFSATFLNLDVTTNDALDKAYDRYKRKLLLWVPAFVLVLTLFAFLLNFGNFLVVQRWLQPNDQTKAELLREKLEEQGKALADRNRILEDRLNALQTEWNTLKSQAGASGGKRP